jgi:hypothetical protein
LTAGTCFPTTAGSAIVPKNPTISVADTVMNQPAINTVPSTTPTPGNIIVPSGPNVTVTTKVAPQTGVSPSTVKIYYAVDSQALAAAPNRPTSAGSGGANYPNTATGSEGPTGTWNITLPASADRQIWFYLEAMQGTATDPFSRNFDIHPDQGAFNYLQCGTSLPTVTITTPSANTASGDQVVNATVTTSIPLSDVYLKVEDDAGATGVPEFNKLGSPRIENMCFVSGGTCSGTPAGGSQVWTYVYAADQITPTARSNVKHTITVTAVNACGMQGTASKNLN